MSIKNIFILQIFLQIILGCNAESKYVFFKSEMREHLQKRAIKKCHGDFKVINEQKFGPYTRALINCPK